MDVRFVANNTHLRGHGVFAHTDPHLELLYRQAHVYRSPIIDEIPRKEPSIVTLGGGRQIGKTTLLKQWMEDLLNNGVAPEALCFLSGELIGDHQQLFTLLQNQLEAMPRDPMAYVVIDEITDIADWDKTIKYLADIGALRKTVLVLSGSDLVLMQDARKRFPGRRGKADKVDFHYYPLSFREYLTLTHQLPPTDFLETDAGPKIMEALYQAFDAYLIHGGFLTAINEFTHTGAIRIATLNTYSDWIRGDILKRGKKEYLLREIMQAIIKHHLKQVSWDNLVKELSMDHTQTIADYVGLLGSMDAVFVQYAIMEDKLKPAPKKRKRLMFPDPFIFHAMNYWLQSCENPFEEQIKALFNNPILYSELVEACVITHFRRFFPTYYIKAKGEVDVAYVYQNKFWPVEIKWGCQLRSNDLKQIQKYPHGKIYARVNRIGAINHLPVIPLPLALMNIS